jgi:hypothetical protein
LGVVATHAVDPEAPTGLVSVAALGSDEPHAHVDIVDRVDAIRWAARQSKTRRRLMTMVLSAMLSIAGAFGLHAVENPAGREAIEEALDSAPIAPDVSHAAGVVVDLLAGPTVVVTGAAVQS